MRKLLFPLLAAILLLLCAAAQPQPRRVEQNDDEAPVAQHHVPWAGRFFGYGAILQLIAIVHFMRRRPENYWIYIIFIGGAVGAAAYLIVEALPDAMRVRNTFRGISRRKRIRMLEAMVLDNPSAGNMEELGDLLLEEKKWARARECFDRAIGSRTDHHDPFYRRGIAAFHLDDFAAAIADFERTVKVDPKYDYGRAQKMLAQSYAAAKRDDEAMRAFDRLLELTSASESVIEAAEFYASHGRATEARELAARIVARKATMPAYQKRRERPYLRRAAALAKS